MFGIQLSGLSVHQKFLDTTSNNIANANTIGFKYSRAEFADIYTNSVFSNSRTAVGLGAVTSTVAQQFKQGSLSGDTGNNLDMAINGNGFFVVNSSETTNNYENLSYTRAGAFELNNAGYIVTPQGDYLQAYDVNDNGKVSNLDLNSTHSILIPHTSGAPKATSVLSIGFNLPANADPLGSAAESAVTKFDHSDSGTYTCSTSQTMHDSLGGTHTLTYYFLKDYVDDNDNTVWRMLTYVDDVPVDLANVSDTDTTDIMQVSSSTSSDDKSQFSVATLTFSSDGNLSTTKPSAFHLKNAQGEFTKPDITRDPAIDKTRTGNLYEAMGGGISNAQQVQLKPSFTQYGSSDFSITTTASDDGYASGQLTNVEVTEDGLIVASYSNGKNKFLGMVAMADFINPQGLKKIGDTQWKASYESGEPIASQANVGTAGTIKDANLEDSNVDLTAQLVNLILAQRGYQANSQALQTQNTVMDAIMNVR
ncbi:MAG: flagellar hook protein FlgE [Succinivibrio sp.]|nr:flagellar hook protein FlgE [Succinivibrio sp.]